MALVGWPACVTRVQVRDRGDVQIEPSTGGSTAL